MTALEQVPDEPDADCYRHGIGEHMHWGVNLHVAALFTGNILSH
jgi:hypothetical protein